MGILTIMKGFRQRKKQTAEVPQQATQDKATLPATKIAGIEITAQRQPPELLEAEFILRLSQELGTIFDGAIKPNMYGFVNEDARRQAQVNIIIG